MKNIVLFGPPGAGKGTQAEKIKHKYDLFHISTGDVFRYNIKNNTKLGVLAKQYMDKGDLVPDQLTIDMLSDVVKSNIDVNGFIFDGFPRTESQAEALDKLLIKFNTSISGMIALEVDDDILIKRLLERGKISGRSDDLNSLISSNTYGNLGALKVTTDKFYRIDGGSTQLEGVKSDIIFPDRYSFIDIH